MLRTKKCHIGIFFILPQLILFYQNPVMTSMSVSFYLIASTLVDRHMPLQLSSVCEAVAALRAAEALFGLLVPILDVLL